MTVFTVITILIVISAAFGYINVRFFKMPNTIGLMVITILFTLGIFASGTVDDRILKSAEAFIGNIDFGSVLLDIMLGFLLFAGALHTNFEQLKVQRWPIILFATLGVLTSTFLIGGMSFYLFKVLNIDVAFIHCLLFGALISPTDPIAVLGILKQAGVPKKLETKIVGESLFNDGVGVVVFLTILNIAQGSSGHGHGDASIGGIIQLFGQEVVGGILMGALLGFITYRLLKSIDDYDIEVMITLACVMAGYEISHRLYISAPLAMVVAGLIVGNSTVRGNSMSKVSEQYVDKFWELIDIMLNAILFVLIGLELLVISFRGEYILAGVICIVLTILARYIALFTPIRLFRKRLNFVPHTNVLMTWGGLRGGISIALALTLPESMNRELFLTITYIVVVFSIVVQGLSVGSLTKKLLGDTLEVREDDH